MYGRLVLLLVFGQEVRNELLLLGRRGVDWRVHGLGGTPRLGHGHKHDRAQGGDRQVVCRHSFSKNGVSGTHGVFWIGGWRERLDDRGYYWMGVACRLLQSGSNNSHKERCVGKIREP